MKKKHHLRRKAIETNNKNVTFFVRLIPWSDDAYGSLKAMFMDLNISVLGHNQKVLNVSDGIGQHASRCSSNASGSSGNRSFSNQFDTFLNGDFKRILVVGDLGELTCVYSIVKIYGIGFLKYCNTMYCLLFCHAKLFTFVGMGKTLLCKKIVDDWKDEKLPIVFRFVFVVNMGEMETKQSIAQAILEQCPYLKNENIPVAEIEGTLLTNTLLLLDGHDESLHTKEVEDIILGRRYRNCHVLLTSRPHGVRKLSHLMEIKVTLDGFARNQIFKLIVHQLESQNEADSFEGCVADNDLESLIQVPLFALLLCRIYKHRKTTPLPGTRKSLFDHFMDSVKPHQQKYTNEEIKLAKQVLSELACKALVNHTKSLLCRNITLDHVKPLEFLLKSNVHHKGDTSGVTFTHEAFKYYFAAMGISEKSTTSVLDKVLSTRMNSMEQYLDADLFHNLMFGFGNPVVNSKVLQKLGDLYHDRDYGISEISTSFVDNRVYFNDDSGCADETTDLNELAMKLIAIDTKQHENDLCSILPLCHNLYKECAERQHIFSSRPLCNAAIYIVDMDTEIEPYDLPSVNAQFVPRNIVFRNFKPNYSISLPEITKNVFSSQRNPSSLRTFDSSLDSVFCRDLASWIRRFEIELDRVTLAGLVVDVHPDVEGSSLTPYSQCSQKLATALIQPHLEFLVLAAIEFKQILWKNIMDRLQVCKALLM